jgi:hypothetical protein
MTRITLGQRIYLGAVAALALWVGFWCYFIPTHSASGIPWQLPSLCATFLGAMYLSGATFNATCMFARRWVDIRVIMPMIAMWTGGLTIISLFYLPLFDFSRPQVWIWFSAYIIYPIIALAQMRTHRRQINNYPQDEPALPGWVKRYLRVQGSLMVILGLALLLATKIMLPIWPWHTHNLMLQLYSAPLLTYGIGSFIFVRQHSWSEIRLGLLAICVFTAAELAASFFYRGMLDGPAFSIAVWFVWLTLTTGMLAFLSWMAFSQRPSHHENSVWQASTEMQSNMEGSR